MTHIGMKVEEGSERVSVESKQNLAGPGALGCRTQNQKKGMGGRGVMWSGDARERCPSASKILFRGLIQIIWFFITGQDCNFLHKVRDRNAPSFIFLRSQKEEIIEWAA